MTNYNTPFGPLLIGIDTRKIQVEETEDRILVDVEYALDVNYEFLTDCHIKIDISPKENSGFLH